MRSSSAQQEYVLDPTYVGYVELCAEVLKSSLLHTVVNYNRTVRTGQEKINYKETSKLRSRNKKFALSQLCHSTCDVLGFDYTFVRDKIILNNLTIGRYE